MAGLDKTVTAQAGRIEEYELDFDIGVAVHACGMVRMPMILYVSTCCTLARTSRFAPTLALPQVPVVIFIAAKMSEDSGRALPMLSPSACVWPCPPQATDHAQMQCVARRVPYLLVARGGLCILCGPTMYNTSS